MKAASFRKESQKKERVSHVKKEKSKKTFSVVSLGCPKNLVDTEAMAGSLIQEGWEFDPIPERTRLVILNTCGFLESAREEAYQTVEEFSALKREGVIDRLLVTGCIVRNGREELASRFPDVDGWFSPFDEDRIPAFLRSLAPVSPSRLSKSKKKKQTVQNPAASETPSDSAAMKPFAELPIYHATPAKSLSFHDEERLLLTSPHSAYLKIADGCDRFCSYCSIPFIRGRFVSKPIEAIEDEAKRLADSGVRELILIAQETTFWGNDLYGQPRLAELLARLKDQGDFAWIRLLYAYPLFFGDDLISLFGFDKASSGGTVLLPYVDLPLQHCNDTLLKKMNRRVGKSQIEELLARLREKIADLTLRTTFITGFPGETDAQFDELVEFVQKWRFERAGVFDFSAEPGTAAFSLDSQLAPEVKERRYEALYRETEKIVGEITRGKIGKTYPVLVDSPVLDEDGFAVENFYLGRTFADSPDIDPIVYLTGENLTIGALYDAEIVDAQGLDLIGVVDSQ